MNQSHVIEMENHFALTNDEFEQQFMQCQLDAQDFTHLAHLRLAYLRIQRDGIEVAKRFIPIHLKVYCESVGAADKFNLTLTIAAIKAVHQFMKKSKADGFSNFIAEFPELRNNFKGLLACHYGFDILNSEKARTTFMDPDLIPFD